MYQLKNYIIKNISSLFFSIYLPLFVIASVTILIKLAKLTSIIHLTFLEMMKLYIFLLPEILFYTIPITFFIATAIALFRLSNDSEMVVIFSLGISPKFIIKTILKPAFLLFLLLAYDFIILVPHSTTMYRNFKEYKQSQTKLNISASKFGHSIGDWLLYVGKNNEDGSYGNIFLFNKKQKEEVLINAKRAEISSKNNVFTLKLTDGEGYSYSKEKFSQAEFKTMYINNTIKSEERKYETPMEYWQSDYRRDNKNKKIILGILFSLFPILSVFLIATIGIVHSRHQKSRIYLYIFLGVLAYFVPTVGLQKPLGFYTIPIVIIPWIIITYMIYRRTILKRF